MRDAAPESSGADCLHRRQAATRHPADGAASLRIAFIIGIFQCCSRAVRQLPAQFLLSGSVFGLITHTHVHTKIAGQSPRLPFIVEHV